MKGSFEVISIIDVIKKAFINESWRRFCFFQLLNYYSQELKIGNFTIFTIVYAKNSLHGYPSDESTIEGKLYIKMFKQGHSNYQFFLSHIILCGSHKTQSFGNGVKCVRTNKFFLCSTGMDKGGYAL
jgi:hypothetical protein